MSNSLNLTIPAKRALKKLGSDIRAARLRRRIPTALMSERAMISRPTLLKIENGDPTVSMGAYVSVLFVLGLTDELADLADLKTDTLGRILDAEQLPKRVRLKKDEG